MLAVLIVCRASAAASGRSATMWAATPACTLIVAIVWATTSCSSRAIRRRSSSTRRRASCSARAWIDATYALRLAIAMPPKQATAISAGIRLNPPPNIPNGSLAAVAAIRRAAVATAQPIARRAGT